jgi:hypothetical protein
VGGGVERESSNRSLVDVMSTIEWFETLSIRTRRLDWCVGLRQSGWWTDRPTDRPATEYIDVPAATAKFEDETGRRRQFGCQCRRLLVAAALWSGGSSGGGGSRPGRARPRDGGTWNLFMVRRSRPVYIILLQETLMPSTFGCCIDAQGATLVALTICLTMQGGPFSFRWKLAALRRKRSSPRWKVVYWIVVDEERHSWRQKFTWLDRRRPLSSATASLRGFDRGSNFANIN